MFLYALFHISESIKDITDFGQTINDWRRKKKT